MLEETGHYTHLTGCSSFQDFLATLIVFRGACVNRLNVSLAFTKVTTIIEPLKLHNDTSVPSINLCGYHSQFEWCRSLPAEVVEDALPLMSRGQCRKTTTIEK